MPRENISSKNGHFEVHRFSDDKREEFDRILDTIEATQQEVDHVIEKEIEHVAGEPNLNLDFSDIGYLNLPDRTDIYGRYFYATPKGKDYPKLNCTVMPSGEITYTIHTSAQSDDKNIFSDYYKAIEFFRTKL
jgi:hypothetical protein